MMGPLLQRSDGEPAPPADDEILTWVKSCQDGDPRAWRPIYDHHFAMIYRLTLRMGILERDAPDVCQEIFLRVFRNLKAFRGDARFGTWLYRVACNEIWRLSRKNILRETLGKLLQREPTAPQEKPDDLAARNDGLRVLQWVLAKMKPKQREVFVLYELENLSMAEIGQVLKCSPETVKSRYRHARADFDRIRRQRELVSLTGGKP
jgi:RNA polymerase sigma-70 factor, ECF subfamily